MMGLTASESLRYEMNKSDYVKPIPFGDMVRDATQAGLAVVDTAKKMREEEAARKFQMLLDTKYEGMQAVYADAKTKGLDVPDPALYAKSDELMVGWYQEVNAAAKKAEATKKMTDFTATLDRPGATFDEGVKSGIKAGVVDPTKGLEILRPSRNRLSGVTGLDAATEARINEVMDQIAKIEAEDGLPLEKRERQALFRAAGVPASVLASKEMENLLAPGAVAGFKARLGNTKEGLALGKERNALARERLSIEDNKDADRKADRAIKRAQEFEKDTAEMAEELTLFAKLDKEIPGGLEGKGGVSGFGFGTKPFRKWFVSEDATKIKVPLQGLLNRVLKRRSGAAVSEQEFERLENEFGITTTSTVEAFRYSLKTYLDVLKSAYDRKKKANPEGASVIDGPAATPPSRATDRPASKGAVKPTDSDPLGVL